MAEHLVCPQTRLKLWFSTVERCGVRFAASNDRPRLTDNADLAVAPNEWPLLDERTNRLNDRDEGA